MKAVIDQDIIVALYAGETEIGALPPGVGIERLRWTGERLVDLADLTEIWVEPHAGGCRLHAIEVPGSTLVPMTYRQRRLLTMNAGHPRLLTTEEISAAAEAERTRQLQADLDRRQDERLGGLARRQQLLTKLVLAMLVAVRLPTAARTAFMDELAQVAKDIFPPVETAAEIRAAIAELKTIMDEHYASARPPEPDPPVYPEGGQ